MRRFVLILALILAVALAAGPAAYADAGGPVIVINIKGEIDGGQAALVHKAMNEAKTRNARAVLVEIDTFGGLVDAATVIRDKISEAPVETICHIKNRAWSAGALIAIAHKKIAIAPGGSIGAAEPIPATEKTIAALKAEFAATANKLGRDPRVAEAMVDKTLGLPGYAEPGKILALTDYQAVKVGYADLVAADRADVLAHFGLAGAPVVEYHQGWAEKLASWLSNPVVKSALLSLIFLAILTEIKTAGLGLGALVGLGAVLLFFASQWLSGLADWVTIALFIAGAVMIVIEIYTPGMGIFGLGGILCILASFFLTLGGDLAALNLMAISLVIAIGVFLLIVKRLPSSRLWARLVLKDSETTTAGFVSSDDYQVYLGRTGVALTLLRPAGVVDIAGTHLDVVSEGQYILAGTKVKVVSVSGNRIVVRPVESQE
ncbi:NfeD family protein [Anaeroselena agilis]|uniref:NfeD family protein n=1 Tax=Anaeroselena agilis TaxID=3063788 RepID=A0ABU3NYV0_9FIRM|nr:NfeD family protein [Selenomonadales bacterium 4137-cl]